MPWLKVNRCRYRLTILIGCFLLLAACGPKVAPPPPLPTWPSEVVTQDGTAYYVRGLRLPGTFQDLRLKQGETSIWVPLDQVEVVRFTGPACNSYRPAQIFLSRGDRLTGQLNIDFLLEGTTDAGYWNMPMSRVERFSLGTE